MTIEIDLALDGSMLVRETLVARAASTQRVPVRRIPLYQLSAGQRIPLAVDVLYVSSDRLELPFATAVEGDYLAVTLGSAERKVARGRRDYQLLYHVDGQLLLRGDREILLWPWLGPGLPYPVERLALSLALPRDIAADGLGWQGPADMMNVTANDRRTEWRISRALERNTRPWLQVSWPRGTLATATDADTVRLFLPATEPLWLIPLATITAPATVTLLAGHAAALDSQQLLVDLGFATVLAIAAGYAPALLNRPRWSIAYVTGFSVLAAATALSLCRNVSPWFALLVLLQLDLLIVWAHYRRRPAGISPQPRPPGRSPRPPQRREPALGGRGTATAPDHRIEPRL
jgi:hypothetical protein